MTSISIRGELKDTLKLAGPIVINQAGHMSMGLVDTIVAGHISTVALAGLGLGANFFFTFTSVSAGCLLSLDTYFAQAIGAKNDRALSHYLRQAFWSCGIAAVVSGLGILLGQWLYLASAPANPTKEAFALYLHTLIWCVPSLFFFFVLQRYWQARHRVWPFTAIILAANVLNLLASVALGLGRWGFPRLGVQGIALATILSRYVMLAAALALTWFRLRPASLRMSSIDWAAQRAFLKLGLPAASHTALEIGAFTIATFLVSTLGAVALAAHNVCLMMASFTFMFPLGFSSAAAVRVGMFVGARQMQLARLAGWLCIGVAVTVMAGFALVYLAFPRALLGFFTNDPEVIRTGTKLLVLVALFQIADGTQVSATGALRGLGNTRAAMVANFLGHYPVGLAVGVVLCFVLGFGVTGLWTGLALGLISVALMLVRAWVRLTRDMSLVQPVALSNR